MSTPEDKWNMDTLARCESCGRVLVRVTDVKQIGKHIGHRLYDTSRITPWELVKIWMGWL